MNPVRAEICFLIAQSIQSLYDQIFEDLETWIETPPSEEIGDYAFPCFKLAKTLRQAPSQIALLLQNAITHQLHHSKFIAHVSQSGGYLNFICDPIHIAQNLLPSILRNDFFAINSSIKRERVMIEYSQPNTHKGFHVGHMRNVALGNSLCKLYAYNGYDVKGVNYIGDVGAHIAKCLWFYLDHQHEIPPEKLKGEWLGKLYTQAVQKLSDLEEEEKAKADAQIGNILKSVENPETEIYQIWQKTRQWSLDDFRQIYQWLDIQFDECFYESELEQAGKKIVLEGLEQGVFERSEGAIGANLDKDSNQNLGFFLLLKSDGNTLYSTKDLALAKKKFSEYQIERSIYVVGSEQTFYFQQFFATLQKIGYPQAKKCFHLPYGLVTLPSGKMSSRAGTVILFSQLRDEMEQYVYDNYLAEYQGIWKDSEIQETARLVASATVKYGMLNQDPNKLIVFSMEGWLRSEGDTGSYLIYSYVRIQSILRKFPQISKSIDEKVFCYLTHDNEHSLIRKLSSFNEVVFSAGETFRPSILTRYLFETAKKFNRAYKTCPVQNAASQQIQTARIVLFEAVGKVLKQGLLLLGITPPERM